MNSASINKKILFSLLFTSLIVTGCSTNRVIGESTRDLFSIYESGSEWLTLVEDDVIAFGKPSTPMPNEPTDSIIVAGKKYSYLINKGGADFFNLINQLNPKYVRVSQDLSFNSPHKNSNDFYGNFRFSYITPAGELSAEETALFKKYGVMPCDCINLSQETKKHIFDIKIAGKIYPVVGNLSTLKPLSKPYSVTIKTLEDKNGKRKLSTKEKFQAIPLLPLTLTIDLLVLPSKVLGAVYQP